MSTSEKLEKVNRIRTDNGIGKRQRTKEQTPISKTLHRKLTMTPIKARGNLTYRGRERVPLLYLTSVVLLLLQTRCHILIFTYPADHQEHHI